MSHFSLVATHCGSLKTYSSDFSGPSGFTSLWWCARGSTENRASRHTVPSYNQRPSWPRKRRTLPGWSRSVLDGPRPRTLQCYNAAARLLHRRVTMRRESCLGFTCACQCVKYIAAAIAVQCEERPGGLASRRRPSRF